LNFPFRRTVIFIRREIRSLFPSKLEDVGFWLLKLGGSIFVCSLFTGMLLPFSLQYVTFYGVLAGSVIAIVGIMLDKS
jgi:hypothetical protein